MSPAFSLSLAALCTLAPALAAQQYGGAFDLERSHFAAASGEVYGTSCVALGDVTADGIGDYAVGAPGHDGVGMVNNGRVQLFSGADGALVHEFEGAISYESLGVALAALPDLDGDLVPDLAIGSRGGPGSVGIWSGSTRTLIRTIAAPVDADDFGESLAVLADFSGNGVDELAIGAERGAVGGLGVGAVYVFDLDDGSQHWLASGAAVGDAFGRAVSRIADVDSDGFDDLLVAAPGYDPAGFSNAGAVHLLSGATGVQILQVDGDGNGLYSGTSVLGLDDLNADGTPDFAIGSVRDTPGTGLFVGSVSVRSGADGSEIRLDWGDEGNENYGAALAEAGDLDGDGIGDWLVGAPGSVYGGRVYVSASSAQGILATLDSDGPNDRFGSALAWLGDHDGDGAPGVLVTGTHMDGGVPGGGGLQVREWVDCISPLDVAISNGAGGTAVFDLDFPEDSTYGSPAQYQVLISGAGTGPEPLFDLLVPLTRDSFFNDTLGKRYPGPVSNPFGALGAGNTASFSVGFAAGGAANLVGREFWLSSAWFEQGGGFALHGFSRAARLEIVP